MSRSRWLLVLGGVALVVAALVLWVRPFGDRRRGSDDAGDDAGPRAGAAASGGGGVGERDVDLSAAGIVRGEVVDEDGQPLDSGTLVLTCLDGDDVRTIAGGTIAIGEDGTFEGPGCRQRVCAELEHPSLLPSEPWMLEAGRDAVLHARAASRLHGRVVAGPGDEPVAAATVSFLAPEGDEDPTAAIPFRTRSTTTDEDGEWSVAWIESPPCSPCVEARSGCPDPPALHETARVMVRAEGFAAITLDLGEDEARGKTADDPWVMRLPVAGDLLTGTLATAEGRAYARAFVLARSIDRPHEQRRGEVDDGTGIFEIDGLGEGAYGVRAIADGVELATAEASAGDHVELVGTVETADVDLVVEVRSNGTPVAEAVIDGGPFSGDRTDMKGQVRAEEVLVGTIALRVRAPGRPAVRHVIEVVASTGDDSIHEVIDLPAS